MTSPDCAGYNFFLLPVSIEIARCAKREACQMPGDLADAYFAAWRSVPALASACSHRDWDESFCRCVTAALCAAKGQVTVAEALLGLNPDVIPDFLQWIRNR